MHNDNASGSSVHGLLEELRSKMNEVDQMGADLFAKGLCNVESMKSGFCSKPGQWTNARWPTAIYCQRHKELVEEFYPDQWVAVEQSKK